MPVLVNSFICISARGGVYHVAGSLGSFSSNSHRKRAVWATCSFGTAFFMITYPLWSQNCQSASESTFNGAPSSVVRRRERLLVAVEGLPGISRCALLGIAIGFACI